MKTKSNRTHWVHLRLSPQEYQKIQQQYQKTTCRSLSQYLRHRLFDAPIITTYRNASLDQYMIQISELLKELNRIGNNQNQAVKKLHTLWRFEEFKPWKTAFTTTNKKLLIHLEHIEKHLEKLTRLWLQL